MAGYGDLLEWKISVRAQIFAVHCGLRLVHLQKFTPVNNERVQFLHSLAVIPCALLAKNF